ncbi:sigma-70 family RNA polymerase sigma factor [bacterium]|nr:sigma-70 family RNA polymerase sigma factor [bacterium]
MPNNTELESERRLIETAKVDPEKFMDLYTKYYDQIYRYVYRRTGGNKDETHDLVSQTFIDALSHIQSFKWQGYPFSSWLYKIAHNNVIKWYRKAEKSNYVPIEEAKNVSDKNRDQQELTDASLAKDQINAIMEKLEEDEREILRLKFFEGLSNIEIAEIMGLSISNIGVKVFRTLKKAKGFLPTKHDLKQSNE